LYDIIPKNSSINKTGSKGKDEEEEKK